MKETLTLLTLALAVHLDAQVRISGKVTDAKTGDPLEYAHVGILNSTIGTVTNTQGDFSFLIPEDQMNSSIGVSYLGYESYLEKLQTVSSPVQIQLSSSGLKLPELTVTVKQRDLLEEAIELIPENHDQGDMRLRGFWRAQMKTGGELIQLTETAFDIFRKEEKDVLQILRGRTARDTTAFEPFDQFNAGVSPRSLFGSSFLKGIGLISKKSRRRHEFELVDVTSYAGRPVYVIRFDKKDNPNKMGFKGEILLDTETLAFVRLKYRLSEKRNPEWEVYGNFFTKRITGLGPSYWRNYELELNYQPVDGQWYFSHAKFNVGWMLIDKDETFNIPIDYKADFVVNEVDKKNIELPEKDERAGKRILASQNTDHGKDFWKDFTVLIPDQDFERAFERIGERNAVRK